MKLFAAIFVQLKNCWQAVHPESCLIALRTPFQDARFWSLCLMPPRITWLDTTLLHPFWSWLIFTPLWNSLVEAPSTLPTERASDFSIFWSWIWLLSRFVYVQQDSRFQIPGAGYVVQQEHLLPPSPATSLSRLWCALSTNLPPPDIAPTICTLFSVSTNLPKTT